MSRIDVQLLKDQIAKSSESQLQSLDSLLQELRKCHESNEITAFSPWALEQVKQTLKLPEDTRNVITAQRALKQLSFDKINDRYDGVHPAYKKTFSWILDDQELDYDTQLATEGSPTVYNHHNDEWIIEDKSVLFARSLSHRKKELAHSFKSWLACGSGFFHISGKIGSGKSTLMKLFCEHPMTEELLMKWVEDKKLIFVKFFFWRPGTDLQKSLSGFYRAVLHDILEECPELIQQLLPELWNKSEKSSSHLGEKKISPSHSQLQSAFNRLIHDQNIYYSRRFCLFIDGLDELEETTSESYDSIVEVLNAWVAAALNDIKICVSSREYTVFMEAFNPRQRLTLQELTWTDIEKYIRGRIVIPASYHSSPRFEEETEHLIGHILENADGVFLWVTLAVKAVNEGLRRRDHLTDLIEKVGRMPQKLQELFIYLLLDVDESSRVEVYITFAYALLSQEFCQLRPSIFGYSFLRDYLRNQRFAMQTDEPWHIKDEHQIKESADQGKTRVTELSKGLLEISLVEYDESESEIWECCLSESLRSIIKVTHRSVYEFFIAICSLNIAGSSETPDLRHGHHKFKCIFSKSGFWEAYVPKRDHHLVRKFDVNDAKCQLYLAELRSYNSTMLECQGPPHTSRNIHIEAHLLMPIADIIDFWMSQRLHRRRGFEYLDCLHTYILEAQGITYDDLCTLGVVLNIHNDICDAETIPDTTGYMGSAISVLHQAACYGYYDLVVWQIGRWPSLLDSDWKIDLLYRSVMLGFFRSEYQPQRLVVWLLERFLPSANSSPRYEGYLQNLKEPLVDLWDLLIRNIVWGIFYDGDEDNHWGDVLAAFIRSGADPHTSFRIFSAPRAEAVECSSPSGDKGIDLDATQGANDIVNTWGLETISGKPGNEKSLRYASLNNPGEERLILVRGDGRKLDLKVRLRLRDQNSSILKGLIEENGGQASLFDMLQYYYPKISANMLRDLPNGELDQPSESPKRHREYERNVQDQKPRKPISHDVEKPSRVVAVSSLVSREEEQHTQRQFRFNAIDTILGSYLLRSCMLVAFGKFV
jgi:hypothetical protein